MTTPGANNDEIAFHWLYATGDFRKMAGGQLNVRFGSKADIEVTLKGCPL